MSHELERLADECQEAVILLDREGVVSYVNSAAETLLGCGRAELIGRPLDALGRAGEQPERRRAEARMVLDDRLAAMSHLAGGLAHEINNPLASVVANLEVAIDSLRTLDPARLGGGAELEALGRELLDVLGDARNGAARVREIVRSLRLFSSPELDRHSLIDLRTMLETTARMTSKPIRERAKLVLDLTSVPAVLGNEARLAQVLLNLILNATQAIPAGAPADNEIRLCTGTDERGWAMVEVRDTGVGIPPEVQDRIFEPFFSTKPIGLGSGLGLSVAHGLVATLGGDIEVTSVPGDTRVRVSLPPAETPAAAAETPAAAAAPPAPSSAGPAVGAASASATGSGRVLVIDDEPAVCTAIRRLLGRAHRIEAVTSPVEALSLMQRDDGYDLILCDLMMPEMTGMELHARLVAAGSPLAERMVFLTGGAFTPVARAFLEQVSNPRVDKPFDGPALIAVVSELIGRWRGASS